MTRGHIVDAEQGTVVIPAVWRCDTALERMRGLLARPPLGAREGLLIDPCSSVHTLFMGYTLDVVFLARDGSIRKVVEALAPWRCAAGFGARATVELVSGEAQRLGLRPGRMLSFHVEGAG